MRAGAANSVVGKRIGLTEKSISEYVALAHSGPYAAWLAPPRALDLIGLDVSNARTPLPIGPNAPGFQPRLGDNDPAAFGHRDKMFEDERRKPGEWLFGIADSAVFAGIGIFHQNRPGAIRAQTRAHVPVAFPQAFVVAANLRSCRIDAAAAGTGVKAMFA